MQKKAMENSKAKREAVISAAEDELHAFLFAVDAVFGRSMIRRAASLWVQGLEMAEWSESDPAPQFRRITIQTAARMAAVCGYPQDGVSESNLLNGVIHNGHERLLTNH